MTFYISWHFTFHDIQHFMTFNISWHFTFHDISHLMTFHISWYFTFHDILYFMAFDISLHLIFHYIRHFMTLDISWHWTFHDISHFMKFVIWHFMTYDTFHLGTYQNIQISIEWFKTLKPLSGMGWTAISVFHQIQTCHFHFSKPPNKEIITLNFHNRNFSNKSKTSNFHFPHHRPWLRIVIW